MTQNNRLWLLISRRLAGEASPAEILELQDLVEQSPDKQQLLGILHSYFSIHTSHRTSQNGAEGIDADMEQKFRRLMTLAPQTHPEIGRGRHFRLRSVIFYAASVAAIFLLSWNLFGRHQPVTAPVRAAAARGGEVVAGPGVRTRLMLPDGTQVWLNSNSKLKYAADFNLHSREVELEGEAYFDVVRDIGRPFIVHASTIDVKVLGTTFTIKSYPQDETIEATLLRGAIEVSGRDNPNAPRVILKPDEKLILNKHLLTAAPRTSAHTVSAAPPKADISVDPVPANIPDSNKVETAWLYNRLVFNGDSFKELAEKMERWYDVRIVFHDDQLYKFRFGGAFADESVRDALNALQLTAPFTYKISGNVIDLYKK